jgi:hypothetical protein
MLALPEKIDMEELLPWEKVIFLTGNGVNGCFT